MDGPDAAADATLNRPISSGTFAKRLRIVPVRIPRADALDDRGALFQRVARVAGELHHSSHSVERVGGAEVAVLEVRLIAVAALKSWRRKRNVRQRSFQDTVFLTTMAALGLALFVIPPSNFSKAVSEFLSHNQR